jgi:hypothetical protein
MELERLQQVIDKIIEKNGKVSYISSFDLDTIRKHLQFLNKDEKVVAICKYPISNKLTAYFLTTAIYHTGVPFPLKLEQNSIALFIMEDIVVDSILIKDNATIFKPLYDCKEAYLDDLLRDFMNS